MFSFKIPFRKKERYGKTLRSSYLSNHGWYLSLEQHKALTSSGRSAALLPYSLADLLDKRLANAMSAYVRWDIFTYRWMLHLVHHVSSDHVSMHRIGESKRGYFERATEIPAAQQEEYALSHAGRFSVMIVDGADKNAEIERLNSMLKPNGVLILVDDQLDPFDYDAINEFMKKHGFKALEFKNPAPLFHELAATLFYRDGNCLGI